MQHRKKIVCLLLAFALLPLFSLRTSAEPALSAASALLMDANSGEVLFAHNADMERRMASTTKIMTAYTALSIASPDEILTIPHDAVGIEGSSAYLSEGETFSLSDLLYALLLQSANDAAYAIAICLSGSVESFVSRMNEEAAKLGLTHTHFENPAGLDGDAHYTTAHDLARITQAALEMPLFATIVSTRKITVPRSDGGAPHVFVNHNKLLSTYEGCVGVKTGFTKKSGRCLVSAAERGGVRLVAVTLDDPDDWRDHKALLDLGFATRRAVKLATGGEALGTIPVTGGVCDSLSYATAEDLLVPLSADHGAIRAEFDLPPFLYAPVAEGDGVGTLRFYLSEGDEKTLLAEASLIALTGAPARRRPSLFSRVRAFFKTLFRKENTP